MGDRCRLQRSGRGVHTKSKKGAALVLIRKCLFYKDLRAFIPRAMLPGWQVLRDRDPRPATLTGNFDPRGRGREVGCNGG